MTRGEEDSARAILTMDGVGCASCAYTIEHVGRKQRGVRDVRVYVGRGEIEVVYDGDRQTLVAIQDIVRQIGHNAEIKDGRTGCGKPDCGGEHRA